MNVDIDRSAKQTVGVPPHPELWTLGPAVAPDGSLVTRRAVRYTELAECECPDDCLRDHENE